MVSSRLKKKFEEWAAPRVGGLASSGATPNTITVAGLASSVAAAWSYLNWSANELMLPLAGMLILLSGFLDAIDGVLARATGKTTAFGGFLDSVSDRYSDAVVLAAIVVSRLCDPIWGMAAVVGSLMVSYTRARAEAAGVGMSAIGFAERAERMLILAVLTFVAYYSREALNMGVIIVAVLSHLTVLQRTLYFYRNSKNTRMV